MDPSALATLLATRPDGGDPPFTLVQRLLNTLPDVAFFAKDAQGRYTHANRTLLDRLRVPELAGLRGRRADEVFPAPLGTRFAAQDDAVLQGGADIAGQLELHLYPNRAPGWCLTWKFAWHAARDGRRVVRGLVGLSRDLASPASRPLGDAHARVAHVVERMRRDYAEPLEIRALAAEAGLSIAQLERHFAHLYGRGPRQWLAQVRLEAALALLAGPASVADVAHACGYTDHSAFTRQFRRTTGLSPREWRDAQAG